MNSLLENDIYKLKFEPNDIKYIVVKSESERSRIRKEIINIKGTRFKREEIRILATRIITMEQIMEDF